MKFLALIFSSLFVLLSTQLKAQLVPLNKQVQDRFNILQQQADSQVFTGYRAMDWLELQKARPLKKKTMQDSVFGLEHRSAIHTPKNDLFRNNWIRAGDDHFAMNIDPYLDVGLGWSNGANHYQPDGAVGVAMKARLANKLSFGLTAYGGIKDFPAYVEQYIAENDGILPGEFKGKIDSKGHYRYGHIDGYLSYVPDKHIAVTAGYGKIFIGDGYRSLLISDNAASYPYLRLKASYWRLTYNVIYNRYENDYEIKGQRQPKYSVMHYLGINIAKRLQFGFFENTIWLGRDSNYRRGFDVNYLNPLILMRPVEFSLGSTDNAFMGFTGKYTFSKGYLYAQAGIDDLNIGATLKHHQQHLNNKYFIQLGIWNRDIFSVKDLDWRFEWNAVRPYTYGHRKIEQNYTHNHQPLTDPLGANFHEFISIFNYSHDRWYGRLENLLALRGENPGSPYNNGEDLWGGESGVPLYGSKTLQGTRNTYFYNKLSVGWLINPANRFALQADIVYRQHRTPSSKESVFIFSLGIRTNLFNHYYDW